MTLGKHEVDRAAQDSTVPADFEVELQFGDSSRQAQRAAQVAGGSPITAAGATFSLAPAPLRRTGSKDPLASPDGREAVAQPVSGRVADGRGVFRRSGSSPAHGGASLMPLQQLGSGVHQHSRTATYASGSAARQGRAEDVVEQLARSNSAVDVIRRSTRYPPASHSVLDVFHEAGSTPSASPPMSAPDSPVADGLTPASSPTNGHTPSG